MRLRYLHVRELHQLKDVAVTFRRDPVLTDRKYSLQFVVGVNGSGKTHLLQALTEALLCLERGEIPPFPVTVAYDLGTGRQARTVMFECPDGSPTDTRLVEFDAVLPDPVDWRRLEAASRDDLAAMKYPPQNWFEFETESWPGSGSIGSYLPPTLLVYTSGATRDWETLFEPRPRDNSDVLAGLLAEVDWEMERPMEWDGTREMAFQFGRGEIDEDIAQQFLQPMRFDESYFVRSNMGIFVGQAELKLVLCAVALAQTRAELANERQDEAAQKQYREKIEASLRNKTPMSGMRGIFNEIGWLWPITLRLDTAAALDEEAEKALRLAATQALNQPGGAGIGRQWIFDLEGMKAGTETHTVEFLMDALGGEKASAFQVFRRLQQWQQAGLLTGMSLVFERRKEVDLLLYDWLSDGERMFLGRVALFYLLHDEMGANEALLLLDEPETHFNDIWKRRIVDMIDDSLRDDPMTVLVSTHSSIELSDVFADEINLVRKNEVTGGAESVPILTPTFGADPSEIMVFVFQATESIGKRAQEYLEEQVNRNWSISERQDLEAIIRNTGGGYYRSELRAKWRQLTGGQEASLPARQADPPVTETPS